MIMTNESAKNIWIHAITCPIIKLTVLAVLLSLGYYLANLYPFLINFVCYLFGSQIS